MSKSDLNMCLSSVSRRGLLIGTSALAVAGPVRAQASRPVERILSLNGIWQFALARSDKEAGALDAFYKPSFDGRRFQKSPVPSNWAILGYEEPIYRGFENGKASEGFYLRDFDMPNEWQDSRILLHFGGVWASAEVWLNGKRLGEHGSGFTSFAFDVSQEVQRGTNRLAVRVRQVHREYAFDVYDDWTIGGIYRDVWLETMPAQRWIDRLSLSTVFDDFYQDADLDLRVMVGDCHKSAGPGHHAAAGVGYALRIVLIDKDGAEVFARQIEVAGHFASDRETRLKARLARPVQWNAEQPYLYTLRVDLIENGTVTHSRTERVGFRQISTDGGVLRINGQAVKLRGVNRHDEHPNVGRATRREHWAEDLRLMKAANINYIRLAHYTPARGFIELCDEVGMYVGNEISIGGAGDLLRDPSYSEAVLLRTFETVARDLNSPSVIYWSIGNEDPLTSMHMLAVSTAKGIDPSRPVLLPWRAERWLPPEIDIVAPHYWTPQMYDELAAQSKRPIITTEFAHAYGNTGMGSLQSRWKALTRHSTGAGGAIWMWADQGLRSPVAKHSHIGTDDYLRISTDGWDGIVDFYRNPTRDYLEVQAVYAQAYPAVETVDFLPGQDSVSIPIQNDFDFTDLQAISLNWSIREEGRELANGTVRIACQPHAVSSFQLPLGAVASTKPDKTYVAWIAFTHANGGEISRRSVELIDRSPSRLTVLAAVPVEVTQGDIVEIKAGQVVYRFSRQLGELASGAVGKDEVMTRLSPVLWHALDENERFLLGDKVAATLPDLRRSTAIVRDWSVVEDSGDVRIRAVVEHIIDLVNRFTATYGYHVRPDGSLTVEYQFLATVKAPWLPVMGMAIQSPPGFDTVTWLGLGPHDAYPNKRLAPILGLWGGAAGSRDVTGTKAMRWAERRNSGGLGFRVWNHGYMEHEANEPETLNILSAVLSRPEKGRKADVSNPQLEPAAGNAFTGQLKIVPILD